MWDVRILGVDLYHIINWFYIYSFLGWAFESTFVSIKEGRVVNRGFISGPFCTIYGCGAVGVYLLLKPVAGCLPLLYLGGVVCPTALEYVVAVMMEALFHASWWDYSQKKYNFQGKICLGSSIAWGFFTILLFYVLQPFVDRIVAFYDVETGQAMVLGVTAVYALDFTVSAVQAADLSLRLQKMGSMVQELAANLQSSRLYGTTREWKEKWEGLEAKSRWDEMIRSCRELLKRPDFGGPKQEQEAKLGELNERYNRLRGRISLVQKRFLRAYPNMKTRAGEMQQYLSELKSRMNGRKQK